MICEPWDVAVVPFPFTDRSGGKRRPALVLSKKRFNGEGHTVLAMITTTSHDSWLGDVAITEHAATGLHVACIVRLKIFTLDNRLIVKRVGRLAAGDREAVGRSIRRHLL